MAKSKSQYVCQQCGYSQSQWAGKCPNCQSWNSMVETPLTETPNHKSQASGKLFKLSEVQAENKVRVSTGESELDSVLGGGMVSGMVILLAGEPGIGKSTLLTQVALNAKETVLYICGEESSTQVSLRVSRLGKKAINNLLLLESTDVEDIAAHIETTKPKLIIVDSIQTLTTGELTGVAGSVGQVRESAQRLAGIAKRLGVPMFLVGHVTKEGNIAGPRVLEHMVDTVLWFEGERSQSLRIVRAVKNRFGPTDEVGVFEMREAGLIGISNPSQLLLAERPTSVPGSVVAVIMEGTRPLLIEIQALVAPTSSPISRRVATGIDYARLQMLVAVLMQRANLNIGNDDVFVNVTGGVKLADRGTDLAICLAIAGAFLKKTVAPDIAAVGEVGLLGEVRKVSGLDKRIKEAKKMGYRVASAESGNSVSSAIKKLLN